MTRPQPEPPEPEAQQQVHDTWLTVPNLVTLLRFLLVPVFVWLMFNNAYWNALIVLVVLFSTDWIDGFLARLLNQVSTVGKWLDPLADRISLWVVVITVVLSGLAPWWLIVALMVPDLLLAGIMALVYAGNPQMQVTILGKARTVALMVGIPMLLFAEAPFLVSPDVWRAVAITILAVGALGHILASLDYLIRGVRNAHKMRQVNLDPRNKVDRDAFLTSM